MRRTILIFIIMASVGFAQHFIPHLDKQTPEFKSFLKEYGIKNLLEKLIPTDSTFIDNFDPASQTMFTFDKNGNILTAKSKGFSYVSSTVDSFVYNKSGKLEKIISSMTEGHASEGAGIISVREFVYSKDKGLITKVLYKEIENGKTRDYGSYDYEYDKKSVLKKITDNTKIVFMGEEMPRCDYIFDAKGKMVKEVSAARIAEHKYDAAGRILETIESVEGLDPYTITYTYDNDGKLLSKKSRSETSFGDVEYLYAATGVLSALQEKWVYGYDIPSTYFVTQYWFNVD